LISAIGKSFLRGAKLADFWRNIDFIFRKKLYLLLEDFKIILCTVLFIVLDLRLTKVGVQRNSFFYALSRAIFPFVFVREKNALAFHPKRTCV